MTEAPDTFDLLCDEFRSVRRRRRRRPAPLAIGLDPRIVPPTATPEAKPAPVAEVAIDLPATERGFLVRPVHFLIPVMNYLIVAALMFLGYPFLDHIIAVMLDAAIARSSFIFVYLLGRIQLATPWIAGVIAVVGWLAIGGLVARSYRDGRIYAAERLPTGLLPPKPSHPVDQVVAYLIAGVLVAFAYWMMYDWVAGILLFFMAMTRFVMGFALALVWTRVLTGILAFIAWLILGHFLSARYAAHVRRVPRRLGRR